MLAAQTKLKQAEKVKQFLYHKNCLHPDFLPIRFLDFLYFPLTKRIKVPQAKVVNTKIPFPLKKKKSTIDELLKNKLTKKQLALLPRAQEIVGTIMILEIPKELQPKETLIAKAYLESNRNIETVVKKDKIHSGEYRLRKVKILAGKKTKETIHQENGIRIKLDLEKTYFSARLGSERLRIARQVKKGEEVLVMFSGAGPYPLVIAKNSPAKLICGVEINPLAHQSALASIILNRFSHKIKVLEGDVRMILPRIKKKFDRIVMPLPKTGELFLGLALKKVKKRGIIHLYAFLREEEITKEAKKVKEICQTYKHPVKVLRKIKCGQFSPGVFRVCFDLKLI